MIQGVLYTSAHGPILFSVYLNDLFFLLNDTNICSFTDDTALYVSDVNCELVLEKLEESFELAAIWFEKNYMN